MKSSHNAPHLKLEFSERYSKAIVCGAPERAELIASKLQKTQTLAKNREYHSYLGQYEGRDILVCSHGVGAAGAMICFQELMDVGAKTIIRMGTAGGLTDDSRIGDIVIPTAAVRKEGVSQLMVPLSYPAVPDLELTLALVEGFRRSGIAVRSGIVVSSDLFYPSLMDPERELFKKANAVAVEMECSALFVAGSLRG